MREHGQLQMIGHSPVTVKAPDSPLPGWLLFLESPIMATNAATEAASAVHNVSPRLLRIYQFLGNKEKGIQPLLPFSRSYFYQGIRDGRFPAGIKVSQGVTVWPEHQILDLIKSLEG